MLALAAALSREFYCSSGANVVDRRVSDKGFSVVAASCWRVEVAAAPVAIVSILVLPANDGHLASADAFLS